MDVCSLSCCGIQEIENIFTERGDSRSILLSIAEDRYPDTPDWGPNTCAFYIFSDTDALDGSRTAPFRWGDSLHQYILANKLGTVHKSRATRNPNSGNLVRVYLWRVRDAKFKAWYEGPACS